ncbi:MAG: NTP transferase domain-containing protein [Planctomycetota bacterium]|nr:NTP transferase domain-containing protein [Planctomycetota bacterium]
MQVIIIGAGRGSRLMPTTADTPKCFAEVGGRRLLDWTLHSLGENPARPLGPENICFVGGYQIEKVQRDYPGFTFRNNDNWQNNNILGSLFYAEDVMQEGFLCAYSDILFTPSVVAGLIESTADIALGVDTCWLERYAERTEHPPDDAEKVTVENGALTGISREISEQDAHGEFIGVARFSPAGAALLKEHYHRCQEQFSGQPWGPAALFEKAYLIQLLEEMIQQGVAMTHVDTAGGYIEIDTQQDFQYAQVQWRENHLER